MTRKCTGILLALSHSRNVIPRSVIKPIVQGLAISIVRYGMSVYGTCGSEQMHREQKVLNFCARVVTGRRRYDHVSDVFRDLRWMRAEELANYHRLCMVHNVITTGLPGALADTLGETGVQRHTHATRSSAAVTLPRIRSESGRRRLSYSAVHSYNELPLIPRATGFRHRLKRHLLRHHDNGPQSD